MVSDVPHALADVVRITPQMSETIEEQTALSYGPHKRHRLDLHRSRSPNGLMPMLVQIHGGGWRRGSRESQGRPLVHHLAELGWLCASIDYRLSPEATFPDHLEDVKRAIAWLRTNAEEFGGDPKFVAVTGGSAGGHLAALAALTGNESDLQPGFETANTSVQACVPLYGIHDLLDRNRVRYPWPFVEATVMKVSPADDPEAWDRASPLTRVNEALRPSSSCTVLTTFWFRRWNRSNSSSPVCRFEESGPLRRDTGSHSRFRRPPFDSQSPRGTRRRIIPGLPLRAFMMASAESSSPFGSSRSEAVTASRRARSIHEPGR